MGGRQGNLPCYYPTVCGNTPTPVTTSAAVDLLAGARESGGAVKKLVGGQPADNRALPTLYGGGGRGSQRLHVGPLVI